MFLSNLSFAMDSNLIITGPVAKYCDVYKDRNDRDYHDDKRDRHHPFQPRSLIGGLPQGGFLSQLKEKTSKVASNVAGLQRKRKNTAAVKTRQSQSGTTHKLVPMRHGDVIYISPVENEEEGCGLCMMSTCVIAERSCVNFWKNEAARNNPYAGLYKIRKVMYDTAFNTNKGSGRKKQEILKQGEAVTFQMLATQKFWCADRGDYADIEKNFMKLGLCENENEISAQFSIRTRYNCKVGNPIYYNDQLYISHEITQLEIRMGDISSVYGSSFFSYGVHRRVEVNLGQLLESNDSAHFFWTINQYCSDESSHVDGDKISVGSCINIQYPHRDAILWGSMNSTVFDIFGPKSRTGKEVPVSSKFYNKNPEFVFKMPLHFKNAFVIENVSSLRGGEVSREGLYRFRHLASNTYLCVENNDSNALVTRLGKVTIRAKDKERIQFLFSSIFQLHMLTSDEEGQSAGTTLLSKTSYLQIIHPTVIMTSKTGYSSSYDQVVEQLLAGKFSISEQEDLSVLTMGSARKRKDNEYLPLVRLAENINNDMFHIPPQSDEDYAKAVDMHKANVIFSTFPEDYDVLVFIKIPGLYWEAFSRVIQEHFLFNNMEADLYQYALLPKSKRAQFSPCREDTLYEMRTLLSQLADLASSKPSSATSSILSANNIYDNEDFVTAMQQFACETRIIDRIMWFLGFPHTMKMTWQILSFQSDKISQIFFLLQKVALQIGKNNKYVQEYIARGKYKGYRALHIDVSVDSFESAVAVSSRRLGYFSAFVRWLQYDEGRTIACLMLEELLFKNTRLTKFFTCKEFIQYVVTIIKRLGPSQAMLQLLACVVSGSGDKNMMNGEIILEVLCSTQADPFCLDNRVMTLIETLQHPNDGGVGGPVYVAWQGSACYDADGVDVENFYFDPTSLGLKSVSVPLSMELTSYALRRGVTPRPMQGVLLEDLAWYIDPPNLYRFWDDDAPTPTTAWKEELKKHEHDPSFAVNVARLTELAGHFFGVINLYKEICKDSVPGMQYLERQFSIEMIGKVITNHKIPSIFKRAFIDLSSNLYIQRYPHMEQPYPNCIRTQQDFDDILDNVEECLNSGRIDGHQFEYEQIVDTSDMQADITFLDQNKQYIKMRYRQYLFEFLPMTYSSSLDKFKLIQDSLFHYFFVARKSSGLIYLQFEATCLDMIFTLLSRGYYSTMKRLTEGLQIAFLNVQSIHKSRSTSKVNNVTQARFQSTVL